MTFEEALKKLIPYEQEHLLRFYEDLSSEEQTALLKQVEALDPKTIADLYQRLVAHPETQIKDTLRAMDSVAFQDLDEAQRTRYWQSGLEEIQKGLVAAFLVAGGQGSRLGFDGPKGAYDIGLPSGKSLFQLQAERIAHIQKCAGGLIPWYIMTSPQNHEETLRFFQLHNHFGLDPQQISFFPQGTLPSVDEDGRILLADKGRISANPNGSGGCFRALKESGGLKDMRRRGIRWIFFYGVDNALVRVCDPYFIGFAKEQDKDVASKTVRKTHSAEHVGVYAYRNGEPSIIEYTELPQELAEATLPSGKLLYGSGNIINHVLKLDFLDKALHFEAAYHVAHKVVETVDETGQKIRPITPNAYKFEALYFDLFRHAQDMALLDVERREEFAPVKNFEGVDSKDTARQMVLALCTSWVRALGLKPLREVEISPLLSIYGEALEANDLQERLDASPNGAIE